MHRAAVARPQISHIVRSLEERGMANIVEIEFDEGVWEIETTGDGRRSEFRINPTTGQPRER